MRFLIPVFLIMILAGCAARDVVKEKEAKKELEFTELLRRKEPGERKLDYEDRWYKYSVDFEYVGDKGEFRYDTLFMGQCPIAKATYSVFDKETKTVVRESTFNQLPCEQCHKR